MSEALRIDRELDAMGVSEAVIDSLHARRTTSLEGLLALRRGAIDAARLIVDNAAELFTPDEIRQTEEYKIGYEANEIIILERMAA